MGVNNLMLAKIMEISSYLQKKGKRWSKNKNYGDSKRFKTFCQELSLNCFLRLFELTEQDLVQMRSGGGTSNTNIVMSGRGGVQASEGEHNNGGDNSTGSLKISEEEMVQMMMQVHCIVTNN